MTYAGQPLNRFEDPKLLTGRGSYVDDVQLPGMLHAAVLRSPHAHARIRSIDVSAAFAQADRVIQQRYHVQRLAPVPLETRGVAASYQADEDFLTVWNSTQAPHGIRRYLAPILKRPQSRMRVIAADVGGSFGEKGCMFPEDVAVPYLSLILGKPVKWVADRQENMLTFHGRGHTADVEAAVKRDGSILGLRVRIIADLGAYCLSSTMLVPLLTSHRIAGPYKIPAISIEVRGVFTNKPPTGAYRGAGGPEAAFCTERTVDLIANDLNLDPAEVRRKNFVSPDAFPYSTPTGMTYDSGDYARGLERTLELADYAHWRGRARQPRGAKDPLIGVGLATVVKASGAQGAYRTDSAQVTIAPTGHVTAYTGVSPHGQGSGTTFAQIVADELGVSPAEVDVQYGDTAMFPEGGGTGASRGLTVDGSALYAVLQEVRRKLARIAAHQLKCSEEEIIFQGGQICRRHHLEQTMSFAAVAAAAYDGAFLPPGVEAGLECSGTYTLPANPYAFGAQVAVVEIDRDSGEVHIVRYVAVHDCGRIINPKLVEGQMYGGIAQGVGQALMEGVVYTLEGQSLTGTLLDYAVPKAAALPPLLLETMETPSPTNPLGVKGIGELPTVAAPVALANAVMDALSSVGVRHLDTPLTAEKIWRALHGRVGV